jgi:hypothetical protein
LQFVAANLVAPSSCLLSGKKSWCTKNSKFNVPTSYPRLSSTISKVHKHMHQLFKIYTSFYHAKSTKVPNYCQHLLKEWTQIEQGRKSTYQRLCVINSTLPDLSIWHSLIHRIILYTIETKLNIHVCTL